LFAWGSRSTAVTSVPSPLVTVINTNHGYYFGVRRTSQQAPGCETWYQLQFAFRNPSNAGSPPLDLVSVLFSSKEDETTADPAIAQFPMITNTLKETRLPHDIFKAVSNLPLTPGRTRLRDNLRNYSDVSVRVRVVTGAQQASPWSMYGHQTKGPDINN
jgi:hypothetical protein